MSTSLARAEFGFEFERGTIAIGVMRDDDGHRRVAEGSGNGIKNAKPKRVDVGGLAKQFLYGLVGISHWDFVGQADRESVLLMRGNRLTSPDDELHCWSCASGR